MRLRLIISDVDVQMKISGWRTEQSGQNWWDDWCDIDLSLNSRYLHYSPRGEILMSGEVMGLCDAFEDLLSGKMSGDENLHFAEPDMEFRLRPAKRMLDTAGCAAQKNGDGNSDVNADWIINFWSADGLGSNAFTMGLAREELQSICTYLRLVTGRVQSDAPEILDMLEQGILLPE